MTPNRQRNRCSLAVTAAVTVALATQLPTHAEDANVGGDARTFGMGGAGLALRYGGGQRLNPASLAFENSPLGLAIPSVGVRTDGLSQNDITDLAKGGDAEVAGRLLRQYAAQDRTISAVSDFSVRVSKFEISTIGAVQGRLQPNAAFGNWLKSGSDDSLTIPLDSRADLIAGGYYALPAVAAGTTLPVKSASAYNYGVGVRVKELKGVYTHYIADASVLADFANDAFHAPEMKGANVLSKTGVGADVGLYLQPRGGQGVGFAATVNNLVNPNLTFDGTDRNGNPAKYKMVGTTVNVGVGYQNHATSIAADLVDIGGATEKAELRLGAEQRVLNAFAVRGGYASNSGYTVGVGIWGFGIAVGRHLPLEASQTLKF